VRPVRCAADSDDPAVSVGRATLAGLCASLAGIGLARFAYTALMPALVAEQWFPAPQAAYLGAANLAGYLAGALAAPRIAGAAPVAVVLRAMMLLATASFFACAQPLSFAWFFGWRFAAGVSGGALMVLAALAVLPYVPVSRRGLAAGVIFTGVGLGIIMSGTLVPLLFRFGLGPTWEGLGLLSLLVTVLAWGGWPKAATPRVPDPQRHNRSAASSAALRALYVEYGLNAVGLVPHMIFLVDFARGLGQGLAAGARYWVVFGLGAVAGPILAGCLADRVGFRAALRLAFLVQALAIGLVVLTNHPGALMASSAIVGAPFLAWCRSRSAECRNWSRATAAARRLGACARPPSLWARRLQPMSSPASSNGAMAGICRCLRPEQGRCCWRSRSIWSGRGRRGSHTPR
jgi:predicted MFS family arabinose efflux permease